MQEKMKFPKTIVKNPNLADIVKVLNGSIASREIIAAARKRFLVSLYRYSGGKVHLAQEVSL